MSIRLAIAVLSFMRGVKSAGVAIPPVVVSLNGVRGIGTIIVVVSASTSSTIVTSTVSTTARALIVV